jgi:hypothetical protein
MMHGILLCSCSTTSFGSVVMTVKVSKSVPASRSFHPLPETCERIRLTVLHCDRERLLCLRIQALPLIKTIRRHQTAAIFDRVTKNRCSCDRLCLGIDRAKSDARVLCPEQKGISPQRMSTSSRSPVSRFIELQAGRSVARHSSSARSRAKQNRGQQIVPQSSVCRSGEHSGHTRDQ